ncbi:MAG: hypothetical protein AABX04_07745 [Nanoarchaeota archaeon]
MELSKIQRVLIAFVLIIVFSIPNIITKDFSLTSFLNQLFLSVLIFVFFYYLLGAFYGKKKDLPHAKYPFGAFQFIRYFGLLPVITLIMGVILLLTKKIWIVLGIGMLLLYLLTFIIIMIHFYYIKKIPRISIMFFSLTYLLSALFFIVLTNDLVKITFLIFFTIISLFTLGYGTLIMMKYILPLSAEFHYQRQLKRMNKK